MNIEKQLSEIAKKLNKEEKDVLAEYKQLQKEFKANMPETDETTIKTWAFNKLIASFRKSLNTGGKSDIKNCIVFGVRDAIDMVAKRRQEHITHYQADPDKAVKMGICNENGEPLFWDTEAVLEKKQDWQLKQNYVEDENGPHNVNGVRYIGKPMPKNDYMKKIYGIVLTETKDGVEPKRFEMTLRGKNALKDVKQFVLCKMNVYVAENKTTNDTDVYYDAGEFNQTECKEVSDEKLVGAFKSLYSKHIININEMGQYADNNQGNYDAFGILRVTVASIRAEPLANGTRMIGVQDESLEIFNDDGELNPPVGVFLPPHIKINFNEGSDVYLFGKVNKNDKGVSVNAHGIFTPSLFRVSEAPEKVMPDVTDDDDDDDGDENW